jgi:membrane carboxypeptidase/penicillin-binding protein
MTSDSLGRVRTVLWLGLCFIVVAGVLLPAMYFHAASKLPQLETEFDVERQLRHTIEGERMSLRAGMTDNSRSMGFVKPRFDHLPRDLVAFYITQQDCPTFFQTPREDGPRWAWRLLSSVWFGTEPAGDGQCERQIAVRLATMLGVHDPLPQAVAAHRLHSFLQKDQLIAYDLAALRFERGVVGVDDAAFKLFGKELGTLELAELAVLSLTLPPYNNYDDVRQCRNKALIKQARDAVLWQLVGNKLLTEEQVNELKLETKPVACHQQ